MARGQVVPPLAGTAVGLVAPRATDASQPAPGGVPTAVRAQLLATALWSLLSTRTMAQNEALTRITTFLMAMP